MPAPLSQPANSDQAPALPRLRTTLLLRIIRESVLTTALGIAVISLASLLAVRTQLLSHATMEVANVATERKSILESTLQQNRERVSLLAAGEGPIANQNAASGAQLIDRELTTHDSSVLGVSIFTSTGMLAGSIGTSLPSGGAFSVGTTLQTMMAPDGTWQAYDIATPLLTSTHQPAGFLSVRFDATPLLERALATLPSDLPGEMFLAKRQDQKTLLVPVPPEISDPTNAINASSTELPLLDRALQGDEGSSDVSEFGSSQALSAYRFLPTLGWGLLVTADADAALLPLQDYASEILILGFLLIIASGAIGFLLARTLVAPLRHVSENLAELRPGHWDFTASVKSGDEVELLDRVVADLTARLRSTYGHLEELVAERTAALAKEYALDRAILDSSPSGLVTLDMAGIVTDVNPAALMLLGLNRSDCLGKPCIDVLQLYQRDVSFTADAHPLLTSLKNRTAFRSGTFSHLSLLKQDQTLLPVLLTVTPLIQGALVLGAIASFTDITEDRQMEYMKSEFINLASHQLRTPLAAIRWNAELLGGDEKSDAAEQQEYVREIVNSSERMGKILNELLRAASFDATTLTGQKSALRLADAVAQAISDAAALAKANEVQVRLAVDDPDLIFQTDPIQLQIILQNLLSNAIKYSLPGGTVTVRVTQTDRTCSIRVEDHGIGIPAGEQPKVFQKFFRARNVRKKVTDGTGLGLYICKESAEILGGTIAFESTEGQGTIFTVTVPLA